MSDYQLWSEQPALWWLNAAISLALTLFFYGAFPIAFSKARKSGITKKRYRGYCICAAIVAYIILVIVYIAVGAEGVPNMFPAVFWTGIFYKIGLSSLDKRGKILAFMPPKPVQSVKEQKPAPQKTSAIPKVQYDKQEQKLEQKTFVINRETGEVLAETTGAIQRENKSMVRFCRNCGCELVPDSKFCSICGTKVVKEW